MLPRRTLLSGKPVSVWPCGGATSSLLNGYMVHNWPNNKMSTRPLAARIKVAARDSGQLGLQTDETEVQFHTLAQAQGQVKKVSMEHNFVVS